MTFKSIASSAGRGIGGGLKAVPKALPLVFSTIAIALSLAGFYRTFLYSHNSLHGTIIGMYATTKTITYHLALSNDGTKDSILASVLVSTWRPDLKLWGQLDLKGGDFRPVVVQAERSIISSFGISLPDSALLCTDVFSRKHIFLPTGEATREVRFALSFRAMDISGRHYSSHITSGYINLFKCDSPDPVIGGQGFGSSLMNLLQNSPDLDTIQGPGPAK